jgi:biotin operon repressor
MRNLTPDQTAILKLLYKFRFATAPLLTQTLNLSSRTSINTRLDTLTRHGYIGRNYDKSYKLLGKPASYFLLPKSFPALKEQGGISPKVIKNIYKDKEASSGFASGCLDILAAHNQLKAQYGDSLKFFTKSQLTTYDYFPKALPDAYIRLKTDKGEEHLFLNIYHDSQPFFTVIRSIRQHIEYAEESGWAETNTDLPVALIVCESLSMQKRLWKQIQKLVADYYDDDLVFALTTIDKLRSGKKSVWYVIDGPDEALPLNDIK